MAQQIKKGDEVVVLSGNHRGLRGNVLQVFPQRQRVLVEGINKRKHHEKRGRGQNTQEGQIVERESPIHISNVMNARRYDERRAGTN